MARIGSVILALLASSPAWAELEFHASTEQQKVGVEDTFRVFIVVGNAPEDSSLEIPSSEDFEVLGRSESSQMSYSVGSGGAGVVRQVRKQTLTVRANRMGMLTFPAAILTAGGKQFKTKPLSIEVVKGRLYAKRGQQNNNPFGLPPGFPQGFPFLDDDLPPTLDLQREPDLPKTEADLFIRASVDKTEVVVGEQVLLSIHVYSRLDLSTVDAVTMPKLEGFLSQDFKSPSQLMPQRRVVNGIPYNEYLLRQKALFPLKSGDVTIEAAEADITAGMFFAGRRLHRKGNELTLKVSPLPPGGTTSLVGRWRLSREAVQDAVTLGDPVQIRVVLEGEGNLQAVQVPPLNAPSAFRVFDPQTSDKLTTGRGIIGGQRTVEYVLVPQKTGSFVLPEMVLPYFDVDKKIYTETRVPALTINVKPGARSGSAGVTAGPSTDGTDQAKNQLVGGGLRSLRHTAAFLGRVTPISTAPWFLPVVAIPPALVLLLWLGAIVKSIFGNESEASRKQLQAKAARKRLSSAEKLASQASPGEFYAEIERAMNGFLEARLGTSVMGLTRDQLNARLTSARVSEKVRNDVLRVYESSDVGRYAPGLGDLATRKQVVDAARATMEEWA
jgi:hypothetical protein